MLSYVNGQKVYVLGNITESDPIVIDVTVSWSVCLSLCLSHRLCIPKNGKNNRTF